MIYVGVVYFLCECFVLNIDCGVEIVVIDECGFFLCGWKVGLDEIVMCKKCWLVDVIGWFGRGGG